MQTKKDLEGLLELENEAHKQISWWKKQTRKEFLHSMSVSKYNVMVAVHNGKIIGYIKAELNIRGHGKFKDLFLENIYVLKNIEGLELLSVWFRNLPIIGVKKRKYVELVTTKENKKIFKKLGFEWIMVYMKRGPKSDKSKT